MNRTRSILQGLVLLLALAAAAPGARGAGGAWTAPDEDRLLARLRSDPLTVVKDEGAGGGVTGARRITLRFGTDEDAQEIEVKWKPAPTGLDGWNNSPRKEIAAYEVQRLFLDPPDHVVPTSAMRCVPVSAFVSAPRPPKPNVAGTRCVLGEVEVWLRDVHIPDEIYDPALFASDPVYAGHMADMNLLTYLIRHQDGRASNFLLGNDPGNRRVYSIDNGIAFGAPMPNFLVRNWKDIRVPALRRASVERLRALPPDAFQRFAVLVEMTRDEDGVLQPTPPTQSRHPEEGLYIGEASIQLGLSREEIADLARRREQLLEDVDAGRIKTF